MPLYKTVRLLPQIKPQTKKQNKTKQKQNPEEKPKAKISQTTLLSSHTGPALPHSTVSPLVFLLLFLKHTLLPGPCISCTVGLGCCQHTSPTLPTPNPIYPCLISFRSLPKCHLLVRPSLTISYPFLLLSPSLLFFSLTQSSDILVCIFMCFCQSLPTISSSVCNNA